MLVKASLLQKIVNMLLLIVAYLRNLGDIVFCFAHDVYRMIVRPV